MAKTIEAKAYTGLQDFTYAKTLLEKLDYQNDIYVYLALINNLYEETRYLFYLDRRRESKEKYLEFDKLFEEGVSCYPNHTQFSGLAKQRNELYKLIQK